MDIGEKKTKGNASNNLNEQSLNTKSVIHKTCTLYLSDIINISIIIIKFQKINKINFK